MALSCQELVPGISAIGGSGSLRSLAAGGPVIRREGRHWGLPARWGAGTVFLLVITSMKVKKEARMFLSALVGVFLTSVCSGSG